MWKKGHLHCFDCSEIKLFHSWQFYAWFFFLLLFLQALDFCLSDLSKLGTVVFFFFKKFFKVFNDVKTIVDLTARMIPA